MSRKEKPNIPFRERVHYGFREARKNYDCYIAIAPFLLIFFLFTILPVLISIFYSFTYFNIIEPPRFIGIKNYVDLLVNDEIFMTSVKNTIIIALITGPGGYMISLLLAWFINELAPLSRAIIITIFYAPSIGGSAYLIWNLLFSSDAYGYINSVLMKFALIQQPIAFLQNTDYMMTILIIVMLWMSMGTGFLAFVAGLQTIDKTMYEAGYVEGITNRWQELWFITLPAMKPQLMFGAVMSITGAFGAGTVGDALFGFPSTSYATHTIMNHLNDYGSIRYEMGYACAIATILFTVCVCANKLMQRILSKVGT